MSVDVFLPQVTRMPIAGPEPFNTLVCVSAERYLGPAQLRDGEVTRFPMRVTTPFRLAGFDQRLQPKFDHSTAAWINSIGPIENGSWVFAVDSVTSAGFSPTDGTYFVDVNAASASDGEAPGTCISFGEGAGVCYYFIQIQVTSWVLCFEPPFVPPRPGHIHSLNDLVQAVTSPAGLPRIATKSPPLTAAAEHTQRVLDQFSTAAAAVTKPDVAIHRTTTPACGKGDSACHPLCG